MTKQGPAPSKKPQAVRSIFEQRVLEEIKKRSQNKKADQLNQALKHLEKKP